MTVIFLLLLSLSTFAFTVPEFIPNVVDESGTLSQTQVNDINYEIDRAQKKGVLTGVLMVKTLGGESIEDASEKVFKKWKLGEKDKDNGILILIAIEDRKMRIEVGYGLEARISDYESSQIIERIIKPNFRENKFSSGIIEAIQRMSLVASGEFQPYEKPLPDESLSFFGPRFLRWVCFFLLFPALIGSIGMIRVKSKFQPKHFSLMARAGISSKWLYYGTPTHEGLCWRIFFSIFPGVIFVIFPVSTDSVPGDLMFFYVFMCVVIFLAISNTLRVVWVSLSEERLERRILEIKEKELRRKRWAKKARKSSSSWSSSGSSSGFSSSSSSSSSFSRSSSSSGGRSGGGGASGSW